jgi:hypothetical protein
MLKISLVIVVLILIINGLFSGPIPVSPESSASFSIENNTSSFLRFVACHENNRVGDRTISSLLIPNKKFEISPEYLNSSIENKIVSIYLISGDEKGNSLLLEDIFDKNCKSNPSVISQIDVDISKNSRIELEINGEIISNGLQKTISSLRIDNTAHLIGMDVANFYKPTGIKPKTENLLFSPTETGLVYISSDSKQNEICIGRKSAKIELKKYQYSREDVYLGFIPLPEGKYTIWPKSEGGCQSIQNTSETIFVFQNQYVIAESTSTLNPMYKASGVTILNTIDKKFKK